MLSEPWEIAVTIHRGCYGSFQRVGATIYSWSLKEGLLISFWLLLLPSSYFLPISSKSLSLVESNQKVKEEGGRRTQWAEVSLHETEQEGECGKCLWALMLKLSSTRVIDPQLTLPLFAIRGLHRSEWSGSMKSLRYWYYVGFPWVFGLQTHLPASQPLASWGSCSL